MATKVLPLILGIAIGAGAIALLNATKGAIAAIDK